jgi:predicted nucleic acid-binding protein
MSPSPVARKVRAGEINEEACEQVLKNFEDDCNRRFVVTPLNTAMAQKAKDLLQKYGRIKPLRALDALHLAACTVSQVEGGLIFVCSDNRFLEIAALEGYEVLNPEAVPESRQK